jgi:hypothetical protein
MNTLSVLLLLLAPQDLNEETFDAIYKSVLPKASDEVWRKIPWRPVLWDAVIEAHEQDKPVLFWGMNGHPMACT